MPRFHPQFRLSTLLWIMLAAACWFDGAEWQRQRKEREFREIFSNLERAVGNPQLQKRQRGFVDMTYESPFGSK